MTINGIAYYIIQTMLKAMVSIIDIEQNIVQPLDKKCRKRKMVCRKRAPDV